MDLVADALRSYEALVLRPRWDALRSQAEASAGVLNWESAPVEAWNRDAAVWYADLVVKWAIKIPPVLQSRDPEGTSNEPDLVSLRRLFDFHISKMTHLQKLGISVPAVPSDVEAVWEGVKAAAAEGISIGGTIAPWFVVGGIALLGLFFWKRN